ncbi:MAG: leucyl/phenylalanyl-tRNA--protein transferase [Alphaproteobacteria bacterium]|nr:leucyl/phenylalanyl-tRNA--protein transferase [Alphaproteobacteria bacterium]
MAASRESRELYWFDPPQRGIIPIEQFHIPKRLCRRLQKCDYRLVIDGDFDQVVAACAAPRAATQEAASDPETWINLNLRQVYQELRERGFAHSIEIWQTDRLVGGLFGIAIGGAFFGESMFHRATDASKIALVHLMALLSQAGFCLLDSQFLTQHLAQFGANEIDRDDYQEKLAAALRVSVVFPSAVDWDYFYRFLASHRAKLSMNIE